MGGACKFFFCEEKMSTTRHPGGRPRTLPLSPLGIKIRRQADRSGIHIDQLAERAGVATGTLYKILSGRITSPRLSTVVALAHALGTPPAKLIG